MGSKSMDYTNCVLCDSVNLETYIYAKDMNAGRNILKCRQCGLVFFEDGKCNTLTLDDSYWDSSEHLRVYEKDIVQEDFKIEFRNRLKAINQLKPKGKILDIGCGIGNFLNVARKDGWEVYGIEISKLAADYARDKFGLNVCEGTVENCNLKDSSVDVITMWDVIEHIQNPLDALVAVRAKLKNGGLLVIKTPDEKSLFKFISIILYKLSKRKISFLLKYVYYMPHYFYYNKKTIQKMLGKFGFEILKIETEETDYNFAKEKIKLHYKKFFSKRLILLILPFAIVVSRFFKLQNKMVVYAVKL